MNKKNTILVMYPPGALGTFLEWAVKYLTGEEKKYTKPVWPDIIDWKTWDGIFKGNPIDFPEYFYPLDEKVTIESYLASDMVYTIARCGTKQLSLQEFVNKYSEFVRKIIIISNVGAELTCIYNHIRGTPDYGKSFLDMFYKDVLPTDAVWEAREKISFSLHNYLVGSRTWHSVTSGNFINAYTRELLDHPEKTIRTLCEYFEFTPDREHTKNFREKTLMWQNNQHYKHKDIICNKIVNSTVNNIQFDWSDNRLSMLDEAFIQMKLRDLHNIELKCYNLNVFPKTSTELRNLIV